MALEMAPWKKMSALRPFWRATDDFWNRFSHEMPLGEPAVGWDFSADLSETDDKIQVKAELPGLEAKDIDVNLSSDVLTIKGEKREEQEDKGEWHYQRERYSGYFQRSFRLPATVRGSEVDAEFKNGVLTINILKSEENKQRKVEVKSG